MQLEVSHVKKIVLYSERKHTPKMHVLRTCIKHILNLLL